MAAAIEGPRVDEEARDGSLDEPMTAAEVDRLARMRPAAFPNAISEWLFGFSLVGSMLMSVSRPRQMVGAGQSIAELDL